MADRRRCAARRCWMLASGVEIFTPACGETRRPGLGQPRHRSHSLSAFARGSEEESRGPGKDRLAINKLPRPRAGARRAVGDAFTPGQAQREGLDLYCDRSDVNKAARIAATGRASARHPLQELLALLRIAPRRKTAAKKPWASA